MFKYLLLLLITLPCSSMAAIFSGTVSSSCRGLSGVPVVATMDLSSNGSSGDPNCFDDPARVTYLTAGLGDFGGGFFWLADTNLPVGVGEVRIDFHADFLGRYMLTGGTGAVLINDLFVVVPDINYRPMLFLNGVQANEFNVEFNVPFTVRAVFDHHEVRTANYGNFTLSMFRLDNQYISVYQDGQFGQPIPTNLRDLVALADVPEPGSVLVVLGLALLAPLKHYRRVRQERNS
jgi:hypothetical protein